MPNQSQMINIKFIIMDLSSKTIDILSFLKKKIISDWGQILETFYGKIYVILTLFFNFLSWLYVFFINFRSGETLLILHYNVDLGVDLLGPASKLYIIPALGLIFFLINSFLLTVFLNSRHLKFLSHLLLAAALVVNLFLFFSLGPIYIANFR